MVQNVSTAATEDFIMVIIVCDTKRLLVFHFISPEVLRWWHGGVNGIHSFTFLFIILYQ